MQSEDHDDAGHPDLRYTGPTPLYRQIVDLIEDQIRRGELKVDGRVLPEHDLQDLYRVSYTTIRRAMEELRERGTVRTVHGRGTYVVRVPIEEAE